MRRNLTDKIFFSVLNVFNTAKKVTNTGWTQKEEKIKDSK